MASPQQNETTSPSSSEKATNVVKLVGEMVLTPGTSLLADGKIAAGGAHVALGFAARCLLGVPGLVYVAANSYSKSVSNKHLHEHLFKDNHAATNAEAEA